MDFFGVVTFEVQMRNGGIVGMEYSNMLIENSSRIVFEARTILKKSFASVDHFFTYYNLKGSESPYSPNMDLLNQRIDVTRVYPFLQSINE